MTALKDYKEHVKASVEAGADVVICGAGLPTTLPELVAGSDTKFAPIVSSAREATLLLKSLERMVSRLQAALLSPKNVMPLMLTNRHI